MGKELLVQMFTQSSPDSSKSLDGAPLSNDAHKGGPDVAGTHVPTGARVKSPLCDEVWPLFMPLSGINSFFFEQ